MPHTRESGQAPPTVAWPPIVDASTTPGERVENLAIARTHLRLSADVKLRATHGTAESIVTAASVVAGALRAGGKLLLCGNGGSAADCQHLAAEFVSRLSKDFHRAALPAIALTTDSSFITAYANDVDFHGVFARQVEALGAPGDVLIGISTSGESENVVRAVQRAREGGLRTIALTGSGGRLGELAHVVVAVDSTDTQLVQECHLALEHILCALVERELFAAPARGFIG